jgi:hypothetical protein
MEHLYYHRSVELPIRTDACRVGTRDAAGDPSSIRVEEPLARIFDDPVEAAPETREIIIGHSIAGRLLLVCFTEPLEDEVQERGDYEEYIADQN